MEFRLLGPMEVVEGERPLPLGGPKQRAVLAHLLLHAGELVSADRLIEEVWGGEAPPAARGSLQAYVSRLRRLLGPGRIEGRAPGYILHASEEEVDALRFETLLRRGRRAVVGDPRAAAETLAQGLSLWRGQLVADLADGVWLAAAAARFEELRLSALEDRIAAELALGNHAEVVGELEALTEEHPLRERFWNQRMVALYRSGRQAEALEAFRRARDILADELGVDPSPDLQRLHVQMLRHDPSLEAIGEPLRGYRLLERIGQGTFGVVHRAIQPQVGRDVAVKVIHPHLANHPEFIRRFEAEAQLVARLEHPHIVPLYDYWREPQGAFLVMRWLRGGSLQAVLADGPLDAPRLAAVLQHVSAGLAAAHREGVVHRDVKPSNILLDTEGNAYLSDFGIAEELLVGGGVALSPRGSSPYLSPEQRRGQPSSPRSDLYGLAAVMFESITGEQPQPSSPPLRELRPDLPSAIEDALTRALADDPADRFAGVDEFAEAVVEALDRTEGPAAIGVEVPNPYKGLRPFLEADAADFFGRQVLTERLLGRLAGGDAAGRLLAVVGPSGSGKSSVVRAGVVPALRAGGPPGVPASFVVEMAPGTDPLVELASALDRVAVDPPSDLLWMLERDVSGLRRALERILPPDGRDLVLIVDQFEELFTLVPDEGRRAHFLSSLEDALAGLDSRLRLVLTLRADFYDRPLRYRRFAEILRSGTEPVIPMSAEELERAISGPAARFGVTVDPALSARMVADVVNEPGALPLLQYALTELFDRRDGATMTLAAYHAIGGVAGALVHRADELYQGLGPEGRAAARQIFLRLVTLGQGTEDTRRRVPRSELMSLDVGRPAVDEVVGAFGAHRLLSFDSDPETREPTVEVAHEALIRTWTRLQDWIEVAREDLGSQARFARAAREWDQSGQDPGYLLQGPRLDQAESWRSGSALALAAVERDFLLASRAHRDALRAEEDARADRERALERRSMSRLRALVAVLTAAAVVAAGLSVFAFDQRRRARDQAARAERQARVATARELAAAARASLDEDPERAILLALEAVDATRAVDGEVLKEAEEALHEAVQASRVVSSFSGLFGIQFSPDGTQVATSQADGTAAVWDPSSGEEVLRLEGHTKRTLSVDWSSDGSLLATSSEDGTAKVWDVATGEALQSFVGHEAGLRSPHFSPDDTMLATTSFDGTTRIWDVQTGEQLTVLERTGGVEFSPDGTRLVLSGPPVTVYEVSTGTPVLTLGEDIPDPRDSTWSGDGRKIAASDGDGFGYVFDARSGERLLTLGGHNDGSTVGEIVFSSDDALLGTASSDGTVRVWDSDSGLELLALRGLGGNVEGVDFSPDGTRVVGSSGSGAAVVWDITEAGSRELLTIPGHTDIVWGMGFGADGSWLATGSVDGTARIWDADTGEELIPLFGFDGTRIEDLALSPDGTRAVGAGEAGIALMWDTGTGDRVRTIRHDAPIYGVRFSPDGGRLITGSTDGAARIWDADSGRRLLEVDAHDRGIIAVTFSPDGRRIATGGMDETAKVWDADTGRELAIMSRHQDNINAAAFSPDGRHLYTAGEDGVLKLWDAATGREIRAIRGHAAGLLDVLLSPDGGRIATASRDGTIRIWDPDTGQELLVLGGHRSGVSALAFSPDGARLAAAGEDGSIRLYTLSIDDLVDLARDRLTRPFTDQECRRYLHVNSCPQGS